jgi:hypothetical protein
MAITLGKRGGTSDVRLWFSTYRAGLGDARAFFLPLLLPPPPSSFSSLLLPSASRHRSFPCNKGVGQYGFDPLLLSWGAFTTTAYRARCHVRSWHMHITRH